MRLQDKINQVVERRDGQALYANLTQCHLSKTRGMYAQALIDGQRVTVTYWRAGIWRETH